MLEPNSLDPDSGAVAARLTARLHDTWHVPAGLVVQPEGDGYGTPFEFSVSQGEFKTMAVLHRADVAAVVSVEATWRTGAMGGVSVCGATDQYDYCDETTARDGTRVASFVDSDPATDAVVAASVLVITPEGAHVAVNQMEPSGGQLVLVLTTEQVVTMGMVVARGLVGDA